MGASHSFSLSCAPDKMYMYRNADLHVHVHTLYTIYIFQNQLHHSSIALIHMYTLPIHGYRRALEAKAALYERLSRGDGLREAEEEDGGEEEGEGGDSRYMVDFTRKVWEDVSTCVHVHCTCTCMCPWLDTHFTCNVS